MVKSDLLTVIQAAVLTGLHTQTIYKALWAGRLSFVVIGGKRFITRAALRQWRRRVEKHKVSM